MHVTCFKTTTFYYYKKLVRIFGIIYHFFGAIICSWIPYRNTCKLVLVVRHDLRMGTGKIASQCSHAAVACYKEAGMRHTSVLRKWELFGQAKVVVKCYSEEEMFSLAKSARALNLIACLVSDAGRTQVPEGEVTVLGIGPGESTSIDQVTGHLKLL